MKNNKQLLQIMLYNIDELLVTGMCGMAKFEMPRAGLCTEKEGRKLFKYIHRNTPSSIIGTKNHGWYWWSQEMIEPRKKWIRQQLKKQTI